MFKFLKNFLGICDCLCRLLVINELKVACNSFLWKFITFHASIKKQIKSEISQFDF